MQIYISRDGQQYGPFSAEETQAHLVTGSLLPTDYAYIEGMASWTTLDQVLQTAAQPVPPSVPLEVQPGQVAQHTNVEQASSRAAALIAGREAKKKQKVVTDKGEAPNKKSKKSGPGFKGLLFKYRAILAGLVIIASGIYIYTGLKDAGGKKIVQAIEVDTKKEESAMDKFQEIKASYDVVINGHIVEIEISDTPVSSVGWAIIKEQKNVKSLILTRCKLKDFDISSVTNLVVLEYLDLSGNELTDACLDSLKAVKGLRTLNMAGTKITPRGFEMLKAALPECNINEKEMTDAEKLANYEKYRERMKGSVKSGEKGAGGKSKGSEKEAKGPGGKTEK